MRDQQPTLIILSPGFAKDENDSTCLPAKQALAKAFNKSYPRLKIIVVAIHYPFVRSVYHWHTNEIISLNTWKKGLLNKIPNSISIWKTLRKLNIEHSVVGILSFWCTYCALIGKYFAKQHHLKHYSWILGQDAKKENRFIKWIRPKPTELIALSDFVAMEFYKNHLVMPQHVIPNGIDPFSFSANGRSRDIDILAVGSLIPLKRYDIFILQIAELKKTFSTIKAMLCGAGPEEKKIKQLIEEYQLEKNISMIGEKPYQEVLSLMQHTKVFLHPSSYEGFGGVCLEALCAGAHVISFFKPMNKSIDHWHIVKNETEMLSKTIELLQSNTIENTSITPYSIDDCAKRILSLYGIIA